jgi:hypothetical protein
MVVKPGFAVAPILWEFRVIMMKFMVLQRISSGDLSAESKINFKVFVEATINPTNDLNVTDEVTLDGLTNVELVYLNNILITVHCSSVKGSSINQD